MPLGVLREIIATREAVAVFYQDKWAASSPSGSRR